MRASAVGGEVAVEASEAHSSDAGRASLPCISVIHQRSGRGSGGGGGVTDDRWERLKLGLGLKVPAGEVTAAAGSVSDRLVETQLLLLGLEREKLCIQIL